MDKLAIRFLNPSDVLDDGQAVSSTMRLYGNGLGSEFVRS